MTKKKISQSKSTQPNNTQKSTFSNVGLDKSFNEKSIFKFTANTNENYEKKNSLQSRYTHLLRKRRRGNQNEIIPINNNQPNFNFNNYYKDPHFENKKKMVD